MMKLIANLVTKKSRFVVAAFILITAFLAMGLPKLEMDPTMNAFIPDDSPIAEISAEVEELFGLDTVTIAILEGDIYTKESLNAIKQITKDLKKVEGINNITGLADAKRMEDDDGFLIVEDLIPKRLNDEKIAAIKNYLNTAYIYKDGLLVSKDGRKATLIIETDAVDVDSLAVVTAVREKLDSDWNGKYWLAGSNLITAEMRQTMQSDLIYLNLFAAFMILIALFFNFRTLRGMVLPLLTVVTGIIWTMGTMGWFDIMITSMSVIGIVAILAVGSSFALHILGRYYHEIAIGKTNREAVYNTMQETGLGVLISGVAISVAMTTFFLSSMPAVRLLGLITALGVFGALMGSVLLVPSILSLSPQPKHYPKLASDGPILRFLKKLAYWDAKNKKAILIVSAVLAVISIFGIVKIIPDSALINYFKEGSVIRTGFNVVEDQFGGSSQFTVLVEGDLNDPELLKSMLELGERSKEIDGIGSSLSIANVVRNLHEVLTGEENLPDSREAVAQELLIYQMSGDVSDITKFMTLDATKGKMSVGMKSVSTQRIEEILDTYENLADEIIGDKAKLQYTGYSLEQLAIQDAIFHDFKTSLTLAILLVIIIDSFVRSYKAALVTIIALLLTIALQYGFLGFLNIRLDLSTMLMGALAIGVGDYAIHLTVRYMEDRRNGLEPEAAMTSAILTSGRSIFFTALTLGAGFSALMFSDFVPIQTLGKLMSFTVITVGITSLTLLPAAVLVFLRNPQGKAKEALNV